MKMEIVDYVTIQRRLHKLGYNPGPIDGVLGKLTLNAIKLFQQSRGLVPDGLVGPATFAAMFGMPAPGETPIYDRMPWFQEAARMGGLKETPGPASNPTIMKMAEDLDIDYSGDDVPWCGLFVAYCIGATLPAEAMPRFPLRARAWQQFGVACPAQMGCVLVFWRKSKASGKGHVGFYFGEDEGAFHVLGGNQSDSVNVRRVPRDRFLDSRWPVTALSPTGEIVIAHNTGKFSTEEG